MTPAERLHQVLSFTEAQALRGVLAALPTDEGIVVGAKVADRYHVARSNIIAALKLAYAAGLIEARSLGTRGTHIRILDRAALEQAVGPGDIPF